MNEGERAAFCAANRIFGFDPRLGYELISHFGSATEIFKTGREELSRILPLNKRRYLDEILPQKVDEADKELRKLESGGCAFVTIEDKEYPELLKECKDAPLGLYVKGERGLDMILKKHLPVAVVGTRDITRYGEQWCNKIVYSLAQSGAKPVIISGLAIGTDAKAHLSALDFGLPTIAVMATGIDAVYPFRHGHLADRISAAEDSALVTDYPPGTDPVALNFVRRNRIIAGLSNAVILVESKVKGGGMITCSLANAYNRTVYALPGRLDDAASGGCNKLIKEKLAEPIIGTEELLRDLGIKARRNEQTRKSISQLFMAKVEDFYSDSLTQDRLQTIIMIARIISQESDTPINDLCARTGLSYTQVAEYTSLLESDCAVKTDLLGRLSINEAWLLV